LLSQCKKKKEVREYAKKDLKIGPDWNSLTKGKRGKESFFKLRREGERGGDRPLPF